jgi:hypothetical protein
VQNNDFASFFVKRDFTLRKGQILQMFENNVRTKIFAPKRSVGMLHKVELCDVFRTLCGVRMMKSGNVLDVWLVWRKQRMRPLGGPRRLEGNIKIDFEEVVSYDQWLMELIQDYVQLRA